MFKYIYELETVFNKAIFTNKYRVAYFIQKMKILKKIEILKFIIGL